MKYIFHCRLNNLPYKKNYAMVYKLNSLKLLNVSFSSYILVDNNRFIHKL